MRKILASLAVVLSASTVPAWAAQRCMTRVTRATAAIENPEGVIRAGSVFGPVTQLRMERKTGRISYCAHGSSCYPSTFLEFTTRCRIEAAADYQDDEESLYATQ